MSPKATEEYNLVVLFPELLSEWDYEKNEKKPTEYAPYSHKKVWWQCSQNPEHVWIATIGSRTGDRKAGCPYCDGRIATDEYNLAVIFPELIREWDYEKNEKKPTEYTPFSSKIVWWICKENPEHEWKASIVSRTRAETGCPYCAGRKVDKTNSLASLYPDIAKEWHPTKNGKLSPTDVTYGSSKKVWWLCDRKHEWKASVSQRTGKKSGCPKCRSMTSKLEIRIYSEFKTLFKDVKWREKIAGSECDIFLPEYELGIEVDGGYYHEDRLEKDKQKGIKLRDKGVTLFRLRNDSLGKIDRTDTLYRYGEGHFGILKRLLKTLLDNYSFQAVDQNKIQDYINSKIMKNSQEYRKIISHLPSPPSEASLLELYTELSEEWDYERNAPLEPSMFLPGSEIKVWWICPNDPDHNYPTSIYSRVSGSGCPYCPSAKSGRRASKGYNLEKEYPELVSEWHPVLNLPLKPSDLTPYSSQKVYWQCSKYPEHVWEETPNRRNAMNLGCPYCSGARVSDLNSVESKLPELVKEWHPTKNGGLTPDQISFGSMIKVWWKCECGYEWQASPNSRSKGRGCPECAKIKRVETRKKKLIEKQGSLADHYPKLVKELHPTKNGELKPSDFPCGSNEKVWWKCSNGHEWKTTIYSRTILRRGCQKCYFENQPTILTKAIIRKRGSLADKYPEIAKEWHHTRNGDLKPSMVTPRSGKKVWWQCEEGHEWEQTVHDRTRPSPCPVCYRKNKNNITDLIGI